MLRDVFYFGKKPNVHPREQYAENLSDARNKATTRDFWIINEFCDYRNFDWDFDFEFLPDEDVWAEDHNNVWPSQHQKDSGTWLCPKEHSDFIIYRGDVDPVIRKNEISENWVELDNIDHTKFDFSWHPDPTDPPYIYKWGCKFYPAQIKHVLEYRVPGATQEKYMDTIAELLPNWDNWVEHQPVDHNHFDFTWRPDPMDPLLNYVWGNKYIDGKVMPTLEYRVEGATETKYLSNLVAVLPDESKFELLEDIDKTKFDFAWRPDPTSPPYIYVWGNQWHTAEEKASVRYTVEGATEYKYMTERTIRKPSDNNWLVPDNLDISSFDFSWEPNPGAPPYIYQFGTQWAMTGGPKYVVPGATESSYVEDMIAITQPCMDNWEIPDNIDTVSFDFSWHPYAEDGPFIYQFGTQWQKTGGPRYVVPGATQVKYVDTRILKATRLVDPDNKCWNTLHPIAEFDFSWHPDDTEEPYVYVFGNQWYSAEEMPTVEYRMPGATEIKYVHDVVAKLKPCMDNWTIPDNVSTWDFDFSWVPHPKAPPYIYKFGTQWAMTGGPVYTVPGATEISYVEDMIATAGPCMDNWEVPDYIAVEEFDFSWHPYAEDDPFIYQFGTQWWETGGPRYIAPGADSNSPIKYIDTRILKAIVKPNKDNWDIPNNLDVSEFDFSWVPHPEAPPYIYEFGTQWQKTGGPRYVVPGATEISYVDAMKAKRLPDKSKFVVVGDVKISQFDYSWHPDDTAPPYNYVFGNNWYEAEEMPTIEYRMDGALEKTFISDVVATLGFDMKHWEIPENVNVNRFDFSWIPHPSAPPYIYQFGTLQDPTDGPRYISPNDNGEVVKLPRIEIEESEETQEIVNQYHIETTLEALIEKHPSEMFWALRHGIDYSDFDFEWRPSIEQAQYVHVFGSGASIKTQTYFVNSALYNKGFTEFNFVDAQEPENVESIDIFFVDRGNTESSSRFDALKAKFGNKIQKTRYLNSWVDTIKRCTNRATSSLIWVLNSELDYSDFNFDYYPNPWQMKMVHVFGTQWSHWGTTFMVNRETFVEDTKYIKIIEHLSNLNFVKDRRAKATQCVYDVVLVDHGNKEATAIENILKSKASGRQVTTIKYETSYLNTLNNYITKLPERKEHYIWVCSSVCDYSNFDFSYIIDPFARDNLHVFPSGSQKFGDTFFLDVNQAKEVLSNIEHLEDYGKINFNGAVKTTRVKEPIIIVEDDTHVNSIDQVEGFPYATLITSDNKNIDNVDIEPMNLWSGKNKNIIISSVGATRITVPIEAKNYVKRELYDYPYIKRLPKLSTSYPLDIVFLSNGETGAEENYEHLLNVTKGLPNRVVRVDGVNGRVAAYHAAAEASETPWFFTVFAKLKVSNKFNWNWQPDRMQVPKHYIFHAKNPVNGLVYGHQAMIAYNKKITLSNAGKGLDFTLDNEHEVVPLLSGVAHYNTDEFSTWRTAFREVLKLRDDGSETAMERLDAWMNKAEGDFAQYSIKGALDADEYYDEVHGDFNKIKLSYEWAWLRDKFEKL